MAVTSVENRSSDRTDMSFVNANVAAAGVQELCPVLNLSQGGLLFKAGRPFAAGEQLVLVLDVPGFAGGATFKAVVAHCREEDGMQYVGVSFKNVEPELSEALRSYVNQALGEQVGLG